MKKTRNMLDRIGTALPLPNVNPNAVSGTSVIASMLFVVFFGFSAQIAFVFLAAALLLDWLDGAVAKKFERTSESGHLVDIASDRMSEGLIFAVAPFFVPWFYLFTFNCFLSLAAVKRRKHIILPLRHAFIIFYAFLLLSGQL